MMQPNNYNIADFHTHILPNMDDGSDSLETSLEMISFSLSQGIEKIVLSSHFYASEDNPENFLKRRNESYQRLCDSLKSKDDLKDIKFYLAAEVAYFPGIGSCEDIKKLVIEGTNYLLLEMPFYFWDKQIIDDVLNIKFNLGLNVIFVHVNRYLKLGFEKYYKKILRNMDCSLFQWNGEAFLDNKHAKKIMKKYYQRGFVHLLGSDTHNMDTRKQNLGDTIALLANENKDILSRISDFQAFLLK